MALDSNHIPKTARSCCPLRPSRVRATAHRNGKRQRDQRCIDGRGHRLGGTRRCRANRCRPACGARRARAWRNRRRLRAAKCRATSPNCSQRSARPLRVQQQVSGNAARSRHRRKRRHCHVRLLRGSVRGRFALRRRRTRIARDTVTGERHYEAVGVAALIVPWNFPMVTPRGIAPRSRRSHRGAEALRIHVAGRARLAEIMTAAGVPDGVVNLVNGGGCGRAARGASARRQDFLHGRHGRGPQSCRARRRT